MNSIIEAQIELEEQQLLEMERCLDIEYFMNTYIKVDIIGGTEAYDRAFKVVNQAQLLNGSAYLLEKQKGIKMTGHIMSIEEGLMPIWEISDKGIKEDYRYKFKKDE
jgi:hypothetical protein